MRSATTSQVCPRNPAGNLTQYISSYCTQTKYSREASQPTKHNFPFRVTALSSLNSTNEKPWDRHTNLPDSVSSPVTAITMFKLSRARIFSRSPCCSVSHCTLSLTLCVWSGHPSTLHKITIKHIDITMTSLADCWSQEDTLLAPPLLLPPSYSPLPLPLYLYTVLFWSYREGEGEEGEGGRGGGGA